MFKGRGEWSEARHRSFVCQGGVTATTRKVDAAEAARIMETSEWRA
jgi:hypothetical protein